MSNLSDGAVSAFKGQKTYAVSPMIPFSAESGGRNSRYAVMERLLNLFENRDVHLPHEDGQIDIIQTFDDLVQNDVYWGGDAVLITVSSQFSGADVSKSLCSDLFVVYDQLEKKYFIDGEEKNFKFAANKKDPDLQP